MAEESSHRIQQGGACFRRSSRPRGSFRRRESAEIRRPREASEPPDLPTAPRGGGGGIRILQCWSVGVPLRRVVVRGDHQGREPVGLVRDVGGYQEMQPRGDGEEAGVSMRISAVASWDC